eukprot:10377167-Heterocapsa_arctica.AAC.1
MEKAHASSSDPSITEGTNDSRRYHRWDQGRKSMDESEGSLRDHSNGPANFPADESCGKAMAVRYRIPCAENQFVQGTF